MAPERALAIRGWGEPDGPIVVFLHAPRDERAAEVEAFKEAIPKAEVRSFPDSGHNVLLDAADQAIPTVEEWLRRTLA
jgi:pimeloyl-ACP methyl ester carboxylesterase